MATSQLLLTISSESRECISSLKSLQSTGSINEVSRQSIDDALGRLKVWATNLGALQPPQSQMSLDHRLRDASKMRTSVLSGLERLQLCSRKALGIISGLIPNRQSTRSSDDLTGSTTDNESTNELDETLLGMHASIDHLFSLAILIRRHRPRGRNAPQSKLLGVDSSPDIINVGDKFPKAKEQPWLLSRLGNATTQRRQYIQYRQQHKQKLAKQRSEKAVLSGDSQTVISGGSTNVTTLATTLEEVSTELPELELPQTVNRMSVMTSATSFVSNFEDEGNMGRQVPELSQMVLDGVHLEYEQPFECPYCRTIQVVANRLEWKRHVFTDLQPYTCTFEDCESDLFSTRHEWLQHERQAHRIRWGCHLCQSNNATFDSEDKLRTHLNRHPGHGITEIQFPLILQASKSPVKYFDSSACPLCHDWEPSSGVTDNSKHFFRHLARHLQQIALEALPLAVDGLEILGTGSESEGDDSSDALEQASSDTGEDNRFETDAHTVSEASYVPGGNMPGAYCRNCRRFRYVPGPGCPQCGSNLEVVERVSHTDETVYATQQPVPRTRNSWHLDRPVGKLNPTQLKIRIDQWDRSYITLIVAFDVTYKSLIDRVDAKLQRYTDKSIGGCTLLLRYRDEDGDIVSIGNDEDLAVAIQELYDPLEDGPYPGTPEIKLFTEINAGAKQTTLTTNSQDKAPLASLPPLPPSNPSQGGGENTMASSSVIAIQPMYVRALYDFRPTDHGYTATEPYLSFEEGDIIQVITQLESGWWDCVLDGVRGWLPSNYCMIEPHPELFSQGVLERSLGSASSDSDANDDEGSGDTPSPGIPQATPDAKWYIDTRPTNLTTQWVLERRKLASSDKKKKYQDMIREFDKKYRKTSQGPFSWSYYTHPDTAESPNHAGNPAIAKEDL